MKAAPLWPLAAPIPTQSHSHSYTHLSQQHPTHYSRIMNYPTPGLRTELDDYLEHFHFRIRQNPCHNEVLSPAQAIQRRDSSQIRNFTLYTTKQKFISNLLTLKAFSRSGSLLSPSKFSSLTSSSSSSSSSSLFPVEEASSVMLTSSRGCSEPLGLWNNEKCELRALACCWLHCYRPIMSRHYCWQPPDL